MKIQNKKFVFDKSNFSLQANADIVMQSSNDISWVFVTERFIWWMLSWDWSHMHFLSTAFVNVDDGSVDVKSDRLWEANFINGD